MHNLKEVHICGTCRAIKPINELRRIGDEAVCVSRYSYEGVVRSSIRRMKFSKENTWIAYQLGKLLAMTVKEQYSGESFDCILYVQAGGKSYMKRHFDQCSIIAEQVGIALGIPVLHNCLMKRNGVVQQSLLNARQRAANIKDAFYIPDGRDVRGKNILLIDDIITTGATISECVKTIIKANAKHVHCATIASSTKIEIEKEKDYAR